MQFGTGANLLGGADPIQEAMQRRGMDMSVLQQQSPASAGFNPMTGKVLPAGGGNPAAGQAPIQASSTGLPQESSEASIIINALSKRLENDSKMKQQQLERGF